MTLCDQEGEASCSKESDDESDGAVEGKWLGVSLAIFFFLIFLAWFVRTLSSRQRRLQLISKFHHCCKEKNPEEGNTIAYPSANHDASNGHATKGAEPQRNGSIGSNRSSRRSSSNSDHSDGGVIYYKPTHPPSHKESVAGAGHSPATKREHFGCYHTEDQHSDEDKATSDKSTLAVPGATRGRYSRGMRKSRSSASVVSGHLAPIQEVEDGAGAGTSAGTGGGTGTDSDAIQQVRARVVDASRQGQLNWSPLGSRSHPDRLASLASDSEDDDDNNEEGRKKLPASKFGRKGVKENIGQHKLDNGHVNVNFVHGSDDDESID